MKKLIFFLTVAIIATSSCSEGNDLTNTCSVDNPVEDLNWLKDHIRNLQEAEETDQKLSQFFYVSQAFYEGETVFVFNNCCPNCNTVVPVKNCNGETIGHLGYKDEDIDHDALEDKVVIWRPDDFFCTVE